MHLKKSAFFLLFIAFGIYGLSAQTKFELDPRQSMLMTGKGPGQDGTINPYDGEDCYAIVKNIGKLPFYVRIEKKGTLIDTFTVAKRETKKFVLLAGQELYLDPNRGGVAKAKVDYAELKE